MRMPYLRHHAKFLVFQKLKIFPARPIQRRAKLRHRAKFLYRSVKPLSRYGRISILQNGGRPICEVLCGLVKPLPSYPIFYFLR